MKWSLAFLGLLEELQFPGSELYTSKLKQQAVDFYPPVFNIT